MLESVLKLWLGFLDHFQGFWFLPVSWFVSKVLDIYVWLSSKNTRKWFFGNVEWAIQTCYKDLDVILRAWIFFQRGWPQKFCVNSLNFHLCFRYSRLRPENENIWKFENSTLFLNWQNRPKWLLNWFFKEVSLWRDFAECFFLCLFSEKNRLNVWKISEWKTFSKL